MSNQRMRRVSTSIAENGAPRHRGNPLSGEGARLDVSLFQPLLCSHARKVGNRDLNRIDHASGIMRVEPERC